MFTVGQTVRHKDGRVGRVTRVGDSNSAGPYSYVDFGGGEVAFYDRDLQAEFSNSTRSQAMLKLNISGPVKEFLVRASYVNPAQGIRETREFDSEAQAKDYAARSVVDGNKGAEAYIYRLERVARLPLPEVDWASNPKGRE